MAYKKGTKVAVLNPNHKTQPFHTYSESVVKRSLAKDKDLKHIAIKKSDKVTIYKVDLSATDKDNVYAVYSTPKSGATKITGKLTNPKTKKASAPLKAPANEEDNQTISIDNVEYTLSNDSTLVIQGQGNMKVKVMESLNESILEDAAKKMFHDFTVNVKMDEDMLQAYVITFEELGDDFHINIALMDEEGNITTQEDLRKAYKEVYPDNEDTMKNIKKLGYTDRQIFIDDVLKLWQTVRSSNDAMKNVVIEKGVTNVSALAFYNSQGLKKVILPNTITNIDMGAFVYCQNLVDINLPDSITNIDIWAFARCQKAKIDSLPAKLTNIGDYAFWCCQNLPEDLIIPDSVMEIGTYSFAQSNIKSATLPQGLTELKEAVFRECTNLTNVNMSDSITDIDDYVFFDCNLQSIKLPAELKNIGKVAFTGNRNLGDFTIPDKVESIGEQAFTFTNITKLVLPDSVKNFDMSSVTNCKNLKELYIGAGVTKIDTYNWSRINPNSTRLTSIKVSENNTVYDSRDNCNGIIDTKANELVLGCSTTKIPASVTSIGDSAFAGAECAYIPDTVTTVYTQCFRNMDKNAIIYCQSEGIKDLVIRDYSKKIDSNFSVKVVVDVTKFE